jgi:hypothetical protein
MNWRTLLSSRTIISLLTVFLFYSSPPKQKALKVHRKNLYIYLLIEQSVKFISAHKCYCVSYSRKKNKIKTDKNELLVCNGQVM